MSLTVKWLLYMPVSSLRGGSRLAGTPVSQFLWKDTWRIAVGKLFSSCQNWFPLKSLFRLRQDPLEAILIIFGRRALIFFCLKALGKKWKMTPLLCACAVVITLETQKCRKRAPRSVEFNFFVNCDRQKRSSQNERRRANLQNVASIFLIFA